MNCVLFVKMDQVFSLKKIKHKKNTGKWQKNTGKVREFCQSGKVGTLHIGVMSSVRTNNQLHNKTCLHQTSTCL